MTPQQINALAQGQAALAFRGRGAVDLVVDGENVGDPLAVAIGLAQRLVIPDAAPATKGPRKK